MKKLERIFLSAAALAVIGCTTIAPTEYYRPAGSVEKPISLGGQYDPNVGLAGEVTITINGEPVIEERVPLFSNTAELSGEYAGKPVLVQLTKVRTFESKYIRADVMIDDERAASLTF
jgi:hypothetical protein